MIIDAHLHVASDLFTPKLFLDGMVDNIIIKMQAGGKPVVRNTVEKYFEGMLQDHYCDRLVSEMDEANISKAVILLPDFTFKLGNSGLSIEEMYNHHRRIMEKHPGRFHVLASPDPRWGSDALVLMIKGIEEFGFSGMKLYPPAGYSPRDKILYPFYEYCQSKGLPVLLHTGGTSPILELDMADPIFIDKPARDFPNLNFILAHACGAYFQTCVMLAKYRPNIYLDVSAFNHKDLVAIDYVLNAGLLHKVIFGTDWPVFSSSGNFSENVNFFKEYFDKSNEFDDELTSMFFAKNIQRLLNS
jgi:predicted TIM-barrel fold metal-dependent hydrolase